MPVRSQQALVTLGLMRRLALIPLLAAGLLVAGCSQVAEATNDLVGEPVQRACETYANVYAEYEKVVDRAGASTEDLQAARDGMVEQLEALADDLGGQAGDLIRQNAEGLSNGNLPSAETLEVLKQGRDALAPFCG
jgi:hypothetical protein